MNGVETSAPALSAISSRQSVDRKEARRSQVLDAAANCFVELGFHNASMARIAREANMSVGHIYHYFENKDAIITAIVERDMQEAVARIEALSNIEEQDFSDILMSRIDHAFTRKTDLFYTSLILEILAESRRSPAISKIVQEQDRACRGRFVKIVEAKTGLPDAENRVEALFAVIGGLTDRMSRHPDLDANTIRPHLQAAINAILKP